MWVIDEIKYKLNNPSNPTNDKFKPDSDAWKCCGETTSMSNVDCCIIVVNLLAWYCLRVNRKQTNRPLVGAAALGFVS